jgi:hypothetical protein
MLRDLGATEQLVISAKFASAHVLHVSSPLLNVHCARCQGPYIRMKLILIT